MMPPFVVFPTNRIAHFVEVSLYLFYLAQQVKLYILSTVRYIVSKRKIPRNRKVSGAFLYGFSLFKMSTQRVGILNYNPPASRVVTIVIRKNHLSVL